MTTELVDIFNIALVKLGLKQLDTEADDENSARILLKEWERFRRKFLYDHHWNGAGRPTTLTQLDGSDPNAVFQFTQPDQWRYTYELPIDYVRIRSLNPVGRNHVSDNDWQVGILPDLNLKVLYSNVPVAGIEYTFDVGNQVHLLSDQMVYAMGYMLAAHTARILASGPIDVQGLKQEALDELVDSKGSEGQEGSQRTLSNEGPLIKSRYRTGFPRF